MSAPVRTFILHGPNEAKALMAFLKSTAGDQVKLGKPLAVHVSIHRRNRSNEQNSLMWVWLGQIARQKVVEGRRYSDEVWNYQMKVECLPDVTSKGKEKWTFTPDGERILSMSTSDLDQGEMQTYLTRFEAHAATELGIELS